jgi:hypothetical protein
LLQKLKWSMMMIFGVKFKAEAKVPITCLEFPQDTS